jgi:tetratricopeptide (TPR) repeat protein
MLDAPTEIPLRIFLSYGHDEYAALAEKLKLDLEAAGHQVWYDRERLSTGVDWEAYIEDGLEWTAAGRPNARFLLLMTPHSMRRPDGYCLNELTRALSRGLPVIPVMAARCEPPLSICRLQYLDVHDCLPPFEGETSIEENRRRWADELAKPNLRYDEYLCRLLEDLRKGQVPFEGVHTRLLRLLDPLPFDADRLAALARFTGREWINERLDAWLAQPQAQRILWITGKPGVGKTAIALWLAHQRRGDVAALHLCQAGNSERRDPRRLVLSLAFQLSTQLPDYQVRLNSLPLEDWLGQSPRPGFEPPNAQALFDRLVIQPLAGGLAHPGRNILVVIDGLDEATRDGRNELAEFIAQEFGKAPLWLRLVLTSREEPELTFALQGLSPSVVDAGAGENLEDLRRFLLHELQPFAHGGPVSPQVVETILEKSEGIFLYAEMVRQELAQGRLSLDRLEQFPQGMGGYYAMFFQRQFPQRRPYREQARPLLEVIAAARQPRQPDWLVQRLGWERYTLEEVCSSLGALFADTAQDIEPFHRTLLDWLSDRKKSGPFWADPTQGHRRLAEWGWTAYLSVGTAGLEDYFLAHLPIHLLEAGRAADAAGLLGDLTYLERAWGSCRNAFLENWAHAEQAGVHKIEVYHAVVEEPGRSAGMAWSLALLFHNTGCLDEAARLYAWLAEQARARNDLDDLQASLFNQANILYARGDLDRALALYKEVEHTFRQLGSLDGLQFSLGNQALILYDRGDLDGAIALYKEVEHTFRKLDNLDGLQTILGNQANILADRGNLGGAMALLKEQERICRQLGSLDGLGASLGNQANILYVRGDLGGAMALHKEEERICRQLGSLDGLQHSLGGQARILDARGELEDAMALMKEQESICRQLSSLEGLQYSLGNQALILKARGDLKVAMALHKEEERICRQLGSLDGLQLSLGNQGLILYSCGDIEEAMALHKEEERICRQLGSLEGLQRSLGNQALIVADGGNLERAMALHKEKEHICRQLSFPYGLAISLANQAVLLHRKGKLDEAKTLRHTAHELAAGCGFVPLAEKIQAAVDASIVEDGIA